MNQIDNSTAIGADLVVPTRDGGYSKGHDTREMILRAALAILIDEGYRAMSMRRVAVACDMKFGNLTYHYRTREDLVRELLDAVIRSYELAFEAIVHDTALSPEDRLTRYCWLVLDDITTKKTTRLFPELWALSNHDRFVYERMHELYARARQPLGQIIADMRPDLAVADQEALTLFVSCSMEGATIFAGYDTPFAQRMGSLKHIATESFIAIAQSFKRA